MRPIAPLICCLIVSSACGPPCAPERFDEDPGAAPGEVRNGFAVDQEFDVTTVPTAAGVACVTCGGVWYFDHRLVEQRRVELQFAGWGALAIGNDTTFVLDRDFGAHPEDYSERHYQLTALSASGQQLWHDDFGLGDASLAVGGSILAGGTSVVVHSDSRASVFDAATGALRWSTPITFRDALAVDANGGLFIAGGAIASPPTFLPHATLRHLDATGAEIWSTTWPTGARLPDHASEVAFDDAALTAGGGALVVGRFLGVSLDVGGQVIPALPVQGASLGTFFVAALDDRGATQWVATVGKEDQESGGILSLQVTPGRDGAVICGDYGGPDVLGLPDTDGVIHGFVARVDPRGGIVAYPVIGDSVLCAALTAGTDDSAVVTMSNQPIYGHPEIRVGNRTFNPNPKQTRIEFYVLDIVL
jgi:hypothetical protein